MFWGEGAKIPWHRKIFFQGFNWIKVIWQVTLEVKWWNVYVLLWVSDWVHRTFEWSVHALPHELNYIRWKLMCFPQFTLNIWQWYSSKGAVEGCLHLATRCQCFAILGLHVRLSKFNCRNFQVLRKYCCSPPPPFFMDFFYYAIVEIPVVSVWEGGLAWVTFLEYCRSTVQILA